MKYGRDIIFNPKKLDLLNIDRQSVSLIREESRVLEIGCATGFVGEYLIKNKNCKVVGVELGKEEAKEARKKLPLVFCGDIEDRKIAGLIEKHDKFDVVYASALVEHLKDPWEALRNWQKFMDKNGCLIITTSNIAHWSIRLNLLRGKFKYQNYGILDNTHLRFFTSATFKKLVEDCGYKIEYFAIDPVGGGFPRISKYLSKIFPNVFAYQMLIKASLS